METDEEKLKKRTKEILQTVCTASAIAYSYSHLSNVNEQNAVVSERDQFNFQHFFCTDIPSLTVLQVL